MATKIRHNQLKAYKVPEMDQLLCPILDLKIWLIRLTNLRKTWIIDQKAREAFVGTSYTRTLTRDTAQENDPPLKTTGKDGGEWEIFLRELFLRAWGSTWLSLTKRICLTWTSSVATPTPDYFQQAFPHTSRQRQKGTIWRSMRGWAAGWPSIKQLGASRRD